MASSKSKRPWKKRKVARSLSWFCFIFRKALEPSSRRFESTETTLFRIVKSKKNLLTQESRLFSAHAYQPQAAELDDRGLENFLKNQQGALDATSLGHETDLNSFHDRASVVFKIHEGEIVLISKINFEGNHRLSSSFLKNQIRSHEGHRLSLEQVKSDREALALSYANQGYPYALIKDEVKREGSQAVLTYHVEEGDLVSVGEILVVGNQRSDNKSIERMLLLKPGQPFSYRKILESESSLRRTGSFRSVAIETIGLTEKKSLVHLVVKLEELNRILLDVGATYDTNDQFTGNVTLSNVNLFGTGRNSVLKLIGGRDIRKAEVILKDPHFIGYNVDAVLDAFVAHNRKPGFTTDEGETSVSILRTFNSRMTFLGRYAIGRTFFTNVIDSTGQAEADHTISKFSLSFNYDHRDSFSDPEEGFLLFSGLDWSNKLIASTFNFIQPKGYFAHYTKLNGRITLMNFFRSEAIKVFGQDILARDQKIFLGGDYSVRGFDEDSLGPLGSDGRPAGGQFLLAQTTELQFKALKNLKLGVFVDHGSLTEDPSQLGSTSLRHAAGAGIRYLTPVGPLRLDYGIKLDRKPGESFGRLHFAFGYTF